MARPDTLDVFFGTERVGVVRDASPLVFEYAASWLQRGQARPVAAIPLLPGPQQSDAVQAFFENLLPEGELRIYLSGQRKASTLFAMLLEVAGDTAGGFVLLPAGQVPQPASYETSSWAALAAVLKAKSVAAIDLQGGDARISLAGAQDKASIALFADGVPHLPRGTAPSTHILKPDIRRLAKVRESAVNETVMMRTAARCGLPTAEVFYEPLTRACVVRRFDRVARADGGLDRLIQYDLCQLAGTVSEKKYEKEGGPSPIHRT
jgi:serine/threonine-protein kinase HipA